MIPVPIDGLALDVDGVLTPRTLLYDGDGKVGKWFHVGDGFALEKVLQVGVKIFWITQRKDPSVAFRAEQLGIPLCFAQGGKSSYIQEWLLKEKLNPEKVIYVGDDLLDLEVFPLVGWPVAVRDADLFVRRKARRVTFREGGKGAVREVCGWILLRKTGSLWFLS